MSAHDPTWRAPPPNSAVTWTMHELPLDVRVLHGLLHRFVWDGGPVHIDGHRGPIQGPDVVELLEAAAYG